MSSNSLFGRVLHSFNAVNMSPPMTDEREEVTVASERMAPGMGMILTSITVLAVVIGAVWYLGTSLAEIKTQLSSVTTLLTSVSSSNSSLDHKVNEMERDAALKWATLEARVMSLEKSGSDKVREVEKELDQLKTDFRVHERVTQDKPIK